MIDAQRFSEVEEIFCELVKDPSVMITQHQILLGQYDRWLKTTANRLRSPILTTIEKEEILGEIRELRKKRMDSLSTIQRATYLQKTLSTEEYAHRAKEDFQAICSLEHVVGASSNKVDIVNFFIRATHQYEGRSYFIGEWGVSFGNLAENQEYKLHIVKTGVKKSWTEKFFDLREYAYPDYRVGVNGFCVGSNEDLLDSLFHSANYAQAMQLLSFVLCSVNEEDTHKIPDAFELEPTKNPLGGIPWPLSMIGPTLSIS